MVINAEGDTNGTEVQLYFRHRQEIMLRQKEMFTSLVDRGQNYTKGILCEEIVRSALREFLPNKVAVAQGFVEGGAAGKRKQCDVLIYDRLEYSPLLEVNDLVILPIGTIHCIIEVKSKLTKGTLRSALENIRAIDTLPQGGAVAKKYIITFCHRRTTEPTIGLLLLLVWGSGEVG